jgi:hypothetical protein
MVQHHTMVHVYVHVYKYNIILTLSHYLKNNLKYKHSGHYQMVVYVRYVRTM